MKYKTYYTCTKCKETSRSMLTHIYDPDKYRTILTEISVCCEQPVSIDRVFMDSGRNNLKYMIDSQERGNCPELSNCKTFYVCLECNEVSDKCKKTIDVLRIGNQGFLILTKNVSICCGDTAKVLKNYVQKDI